MTLVQLLIGAGAVLLVFLFGFWCGAWLGMWLSEVEDDEFETDAFKREVILSRRRAHEKPAFGLNG